MDSLVQSKDLPRSDHLQSLGCLRKARVSRCLQQGCFHADCLAGGNLHLLGLPLSDPVCFIVNIFRVSRRNFLTHHQHMVIRKTEGTWEKHPHGCKNGLVCQLDAVVKQHLGGGAHDGELVLPRAPQGGIKMAHRLLQLLNQQTIQSTLGGAFHIRKVDLYVKKMHSPCHRHLLLVSVTKRVSSAEICNTIG